eukprot:TRINITY_DN190_c0_g1_i1.p1 TRINITY_DN190_c0_g1~~TRINITY_DN190_c0_g1_i1.p1  ORF type:complete len:1502 (+),score=339.14 TRINITY_DN190_c0_g1_i1:91-4506(+)
MTPRGATRWAAPLLAVAAFCGAGEAHSDGDHSHNHSHVHQCVHDRIVRSNWRRAPLRVPDSEAAVRRRRAAAADASGDSRPLRIRYHFVPGGEGTGCEVGNERVACTCSPSDQRAVSFETNQPAPCTGSSVLGPRETKIITDALDAAAARLSAVLRVRGGGIGAVPLGGRTCSPGGAAGVVLPAADRDTGVPGADFVAYVTASPPAPGSPLTGDGSYLAWAASCRTEEDGRPVAGIINWNPVLLTEGITLDSATEAATHELIHALGFGAETFAGQVESGPSGKWKAMTQRSDHGWAITTAKVQEKARAHFDCPGLQGVLLESQGAAGTAGSHWDKQVMGSELMTGVLTPGQKEALSAATLAVFEDIGFYSVDYSKADDFAWGKDRGCAFANGAPCNTLVEPGPEFCFPDDVLNEEDPSAAPLRCTPDRLAVGNCALGRYKTNLPPKMRYFSDPKVGGIMSLANYCPMTLARYSCADPLNDCGTHRNARKCHSDVRCAWEHSTCRARSLDDGSDFSTSSRCFTADEAEPLQRTGADADFGAKLGARCFAVDCSGNATSYRVRVGSSDWIACDGEGDGQWETPSRAWQGTLRCPKKAAVCTFTPPAPAAALAAAASAAVATPPPTPRPVGPELGECPWTEPASEVGALQCADRSECRPADAGWDCCAASGGRARCPPELPVMCAQGDVTRCGGDHCCAQSAEDCQLSASHGSALQLEGVSETVAFTDREGMLNRLRMDGGSLVWEVCLAGAYGNYGALGALNPGGQLYGGLYGAWYGEFDLYGGDGLGYGQYGGLYGGSRNDLAYLWGYGYGAGYGYEYAAAGARQGRPSDEYEYGDSEGSEVSSGDEYDAYDAAEVRKGRPKSYDYAEYKDKVGLKDTDDADTSGSGDEYDTYDAAAGVRKGRPNSYDYAEYEDKVDSKDTDDADTSGPGDKHDAYDAAAEVRKGRPKSYAYAEYEDKVDSKDADDADDAAAEVRQGRPESDYDDGSSEGYHGDYADHYANHTGYGGYLDHYSYYSEPEPEADYADFYAYYEHANGSHYAYHYQHPDLYSYPDLYAYHYQHPDLYSYPDLYTYMDFDGYDYSDQHHYGYKGYNHRAYGYAYAGQGSDYGEYHDAGDYPDYSYSSSPAAYGGYAEGERRSGEVESNGAYDGSQSGSGSSDASCSLTVIHVGSLGFDQGNCTIFGSGVSSTPQDAAACTALKALVQLEQGMGGPRQCSGSAGKSAADAAKVAAAAAAAGGEGLARRLSVRVTQRGCECLREWACMTCMAAPWRLGTPLNPCTGSCCNPDSDVNGDWCMVADPDCEGSHAGYCAAPGQGVARVSVPGTPTGANQTLPVAAGAGEDGAPVDDTSADSGSGAGLGDTKWRPGSSFAKTSGAAGVIVLPPDSARAVLVVGSVLLLCVAMLCYRRARRRAPSGYNPVRAVPGHPAPCSAQWQGTLPTIPTVCPVCTRGNCAGAGECVACGARLGADVPV